MAQIKRIPYMGSKNKHSIEILQIITSRIDTTKPRTFYDLFGGGGAITTTALEYFHPYFSEVVYNELDSGISSLFTLLTLGSEEDKQEFFDKTSDWVSRETFFENKDNPTPYGGFVKSCYSFGNDGRGYAFSVGVEATKKLGHEFVVNKKGWEELKKIFPEFDIDKSFWVEEDLNLRRLIFIKAIGKCYSPLESNKQLKRLQHLERLQQLQQLQQLDLNINLTTHNQSYENVFLEKNAVVYLDPPYDNTKKYSINKNLQGLKKYLETLTNQNIPVFVSEYANPHADLLASVWKKKTRSTFSPSSNSTQRTEQLFWNGVK